MTGVHARTAPGRGGRVSEAASARYLGRLDCQAPAPAACAFRFMPLGALRSTGACTGSTV